MNRKAYTLIHNPYKAFAYMGSKGHFKWMNDKTYLSLYYRGVFGKDIDWDNPKTFNEKLQWLKLHDRNPKYVQMVDKYEAKEYVRSIIGEQYIIPTYGIWNSFEEIDFSILPNSFVLKCTHDSGGLVICKDKNKLDYDKARDKISRCLKKNFFYFGREWPYKNVKPRIIAEKYMEDNSTSELRDYKFFCFNGVAKCFKVDFDRFTKHGANYYDFEKRLLHLGEVMCPPNPDKVVEIPKSYLMMKELAERLSLNVPFLRTDFYDVDGEIYFGELTFFPQSGFGKFIYDDNDTMLGTWMRLPEKMGGGVLHSI